MKNKKQSGITLVALVVTVVVLLILAGASINLVLGENGLITQAKEAKEKTLEAEKAEGENLNNASYYIKQTAGVNASGITVDDYGKVVTNYQDGHTWEIFYADNNNVYLITREKEGGQTLNDKITGYNGTSDFDGSDDFKTKYPAVQAGWLNKTYTPSTNGAGTVNYTSSYDNMKCTEYLLNSSVWNTTYKTAKADWAIGAPTLELLAASYGKYEGTTVTIADPSGTGYAKTITEGLTTSKANGLYNHGYHYWLACPSNSNDNYVRAVRASNACVASTNYDASIVVRPVVCLNSDVILKKSSDGNTFTIN